MPKKKNSVSKKQAPVNVPEEKEEVEDVEEEIKITKAGTPSGVKAIDIVDLQENYIRTYCEATHGKGFMELAKAFVSPVKNSSNFGKRPDGQKVGRKMITHNDKVSNAVVIDKNNMNRGEFSKDLMGIHFREQAMAFCNAGLPEKIKQPDGSYFEKLEKLLKCRIEYS